MALLSLGSPDLELSPSRESLADTLKKLGQPSCGLPRGAWTYPSFPGDQLGPRLVSALGGAGTLIATRGRGRGVLTPAFPSSIDWLEDEFFSHSPAGPGRSLSGPVVGESLALVLPCCSVSAAGLIYKQELM